MLITPGVLIGALGGLILIASLGGASGPQKGWEVALFPLLGGVGLLVTGILLSSTRQAGWGLFGAVIITGFAAVPMIITQRPHFGGIVILIYSICVWVKFGKLRAAQIEGD